MKHLLFILISVFGWLLSEASSLQLSEYRFALNIGDTLTIAVFGTDAEGNISWSSSDLSVVTVSSDGMVTAVSGGQATITAASTVHPGQTATCTVVVLPDYSNAEPVQPLLREDLTWVGCIGYSQTYDFAYTITVEGDTVVDGVTYKKVYRRKLGEEPYELQGHGIFVSDSRPAACLREVNGVVYRMCENNSSSSQFSYNYDDVSGNHADYLYPKINRTETHYEVILYNFHDPNMVYKYAQHLEPASSLMVEGILRSCYVDDNAELQLIEGIGMMPRGEGFSDMLAPASLLLSRNVTKPWALFVLDAAGRVIYDNYNFYNLNHSEYAFFCSYFLGVDRFDFTGDGTVDIEDVSFAINSVLDPYNFDMKADINSDRSVDIMDVNAVINEVLSK
ncbi:MAG: Ig-like domain-containing protein [Muribaculaceae bacterium]|nr:Ig-like domain-containing protein [Muribaculaceae bacterium]